MAEGGYDENERLIDPTDKQDFDFNEGLEMEQIRRETSTPFNTHEEETSFGGRTRPIELRGMIRSKLRDDVRNFFPEMTDSIEVKQINGRLSVRIYGNEDWTNLLKTNGKIDSGQFSKELKNELGPTKESLYKKNIEKLKIEEVNRILKENFPDFDLNSGNYPFYINFNENGTIEVKLENRSPFI